MARKQDKDKAGEVACFQTNLRTILATKKINMYKVISNQ